MNNKKLVAGVSLSKFMIQDVSVLLLLFILITHSVASATLPDTLTVTVDKGGKPVTLRLERATNLRTTETKYYTWDTANGYLEVAAPECRVFHGTVDEESNTLVMAMIYPETSTYRPGVMVVHGFNAEAFKGGRYWSGSYDVTSQLSGNPGGSAYPVVGAGTGGISRLTGPTVEPPHRYIPPRGGQYICEVAVEHPFDSRLTVTEQVMRMEHQFLTYAYIMARDAMVQIQITAFCVRLDKYYGGGTTTTPGLGELRSTWLNNAPLNNHADYDLLHILNVGGSAWVNTAGSSWGVSRGALYHEAGHNWGGKHLAYSHDNQWGNRWSNLEVTIDRVLARRNTIINSGALDPPTGPYPYPLHPYTHADLAYTPVDTPLEINVIANDWDGNDDNLTVIDAVASDGTVDNLGGGILRYTPNPGYVGKAHVVYTVQDNSSLGLKARDIAFIEVVNNDLTVHYEFEETSGSVVSDSCDVGEAGSLNGGDFATDSIIGPVGQGVHIKSGSGIIVGTRPILPVPPATGDRPAPFEANINAQGNFYDPMGESYSLAFWVRVDNWSATNYVSVAKYSFSEAPTGFRFLIYPNKLQLQVQEFDGSQGKDTLNYTTTIGEERWHHVALVFDRATHEIRMSVDGVEGLVNTTALRPESFIFDGRRPLRIGQDSKGQMRVDDFRIYTKALTQTEVQGLYDMGLVPAHTPEPVNNEINVELNSVLSWGAGNPSYQHDVYLGTDPVAVANATADSPEYMGRLTATSFNPGGLLPSTRYYWRVDEITTNNVVIPGKVWSFETPVDLSSLENGLMAHWMLDETDGTVVYDATENGHNGILSGGLQGVVAVLGTAYEFDGNDSIETVNPFSFMGPDGTYSITGWIRTTYSSAEQDIVAATSSGHGILLEIRTNGQLRYLHRYPYGSTGGTEVFSGVSINDGDWHQFAAVKTTDAIKLYVDGQFRVESSDTTVIPKTEALDIAIGKLMVGNNSRMLRGGIDDIRLYDRALTPGEVDALFSNTSADQLLTLDLEAHWRLDETEGTVVDDAAANGHIGSLTGGLQGVTGVVKKAYEFDGNDSIKIDSPFAFASGGEYSISGWLRTTYSGSEQDILAATSSGSHGIILEVGTDGRLRFLHRYPYGDTGGASIYSDGSIADGQWHHFVAVKTAEAAKLYVDGYYESQAADTTVIPDALNVVIGKLSVNSNTRMFNGSLDDIRIYTRALTAYEVAYLKGIEQADLRADFDNSGVVDFMDLALLASHWLDCGLPECH